MPIRREAFSRLALALGCFLSAGSLTAADTEAPWFDRQTKWHGYDQFHFRIDERPAYIVVPKQAAPGKPWVWRARFPNYHAEMDVTLLGKGLHLVYVDVAGLFGSPGAVAIGDKLYTYVTTRHGLSARPASRRPSSPGV